MSSPVSPKPRRSSVAGPDLGPLLCFGAEFCSPGVDLPRQNGGLKGGLDDPAGVFEKRLVVEDPLRS
jgi:hypothetical protein